MTAGARQPGRGVGGKRRRTATWLAWSMWALSVPPAALSGLLGFLNASARNQTEVGFGVLLAVLLLTFPTVGALVASRRPENPIGWIFCVVGLLFGVGAFADTYASYALSAHPGALPGVEYAAWVAAWIGGPSGLLAAALLFLLFPTGTLPSRRWRPVAAMAFIGSPLTALGWAFEPGPLDTQSSIDNPLGIRGAVGGVLETLGTIGGALLNVSLLAAALSLILRLRRARGVERQQLKWFAYSATMMVGGFAASLVLSGLANSIAWSLGFLGFMVLPVATGIAILRYRLYDIDRIINRTLVYGTLTAILLMMYLGSVVSLRGLLFGFTGQSSQLTIVASTLAAAALFNPLRRRIQSFIDRRFYRKKYDARKTLEAFSIRLRDETDLETLYGELAGVVRDTMQPEYVSVWLRPEVAPKGERAD
ncbi:MAG: hypothetical protein M3Q29_23235 [Chloroflexota bacterium]|nr:hypothetical protein [Chloroflexota bacterium]